MQIPAGGLVIVGAATPLVLTFITDETFGGTYTVAATASTVPGQNVTVSGSPATCSTKSVVSGVCVGAADQQVGALTMPTLPASP